MFIAEYVARSEHERLFPQTASTHNCVFNLGPSFLSALHAWVYWGYD